MKTILPRYRAARRLGDGSLRGTSRDARLSDFWSWAFSDLVSNATRGVFAEWLVAQALGLELGVRDEWAAHDLVFEGRTLEVKSSSYVQTWAQSKLSTPSFGIAPTRAWSSDTGVYASAVRRQAEVYVFALLAERDPARLDPLDVHQWRFFVVPTRALDDDVGAQRTLSLSALRRLAPPDVDFASLPEAVRGAR